MKKIIFSHFENIRDKTPKTITADDFINSIRTGDVNGNCIKPVIERIRRTQDRDERGKLKKGLPAVTISAICQKGHKKADIISLTHFLQIDIDKIENPEAIKKVLSQDPYLYLLFVSPSGNGIKGIIYTGERNHKDAFQALKTYFLKQYELTIDEQVKDESRLCFYSFDPDIYVNPDAATFEMPTLQSPPRNETTRIKVEDVVGKVESAQLDFTASYEDWLKLAFAFVDEFGADGEQYFHRISKFYGGYSHESCSDQYLKCLHDGSHSVGIDFFFEKAGKLLPSIEVSNSPIPPIPAATSLNNIKFYQPSYDKDGQLKDIKIDYMKWIDLLYGLGFRRFDIDMNFSFVSVQDQIIQEVSVTHIQDAFINYLEGLPENLGEGITKESIIGKIYRNPSHYFCDKRLNLLKPKQPFVFNYDTKDECYIYYRNGFVKCTSSGYKLSAYTELKGLIWRDQIVDRDFAPVDIDSLPPDVKGDFSAFLLNICGKDEKRFNALRTIIGYLLHSFYAGKLKAVVFTDSKISDSPSGRTGKTLLGQALGYLKKYTEINGKDFDPANKHKYSQAHLDTQIIHLNDVRKHFDFETVFNDITEGIVVDIKNAKPFKIKSKLIVSTNQTLRIEGASAKDRAVEFEFADHYSENYSPEDEFGHWFFRDWDNGQWQLFDNFCLGCIATYLAEGVITPVQINLNRRKLHQTTSVEFVEFMDSLVSEGQIKAGIEYEKKDLYLKFVEDCPDFAELKGAKQRRFTEWLRNYARYSGYFSPVEPERHERKSGVARYIVFPPP
ncbi:MAG: BT4734/BF3469 family protein [Bacteroidota bacterium]